MSVPTPLALTPTPPYYAVVFTSVRTPADADEYGVTADRMVELAAGMPGFLGVESARGEDRVGITVSYWASLDAIRGWREHAEHRLAQQHGREKWYACYRLRVARVESEYGFDG